MVQQKNHETRYNYFWCINNHISKKLQNIKYIILLGDTNSQDIKNELQRIHNCFPNFKINITNLNQATNLCGNNNIDNVILLQKEEITEDNLILKLSDIKLDKKSSSNSNSKSIQELFRENIYVRSVFQRCSRPNSTTDQCRNGAHYPILTLIPNQMIPN